MFENILKIGLNGTLIVYYVNGTLRIVLLTGSVY